MRTFKAFVLSVFLVGPVVAFAGVEYGNEARPKAEDDENSRNLFSLEATHTFSSDFHHDELGDGDSSLLDFSYDHRFLIKGKWFFRAGIEYERFDFGGTDNGLPDHLQAAYGHLAVEYVVHDHAGASIEFSPGAYFQDSINSDALDSPVKIFVSFPLKKDKVFGVIGIGAGLYQDPIVAPGGGIIWLISDKMRLEGVFPKPALVFEPNDDWQFRVLGELRYQSYRTDDVVTNSPGLNLHNAVVQYSEDRIGVQAKYSGCKPFNFIVGAGYTVRRDFDFFRADHGAALDPAPYVRLGIEANF